MKEYEYRVYVDDVFGAERLGGVVWATDKASAKTLAESMRIECITSVEVVCDEEAEAIRRYKAGEKPSFSTGICEFLEFLTCGYGTCDPYGYFEFPLYPAEDYLARERNRVYEETISFVGQKCSI